MSHLHALWNDLWPNTVAPSLWTLLGIGAHYVASRRQARKHHEDMKQHVTNTAGGPSGQADTA